MLVGQPYTQTRNEHSSCPFYAAAARAATVGWGVSAAPNPASRAKPSSVKRLPRSWEALHDRLGMIMPLANGGGLG